MISNGQAPCVGGPGGSFQTVPRRNTKTTDRNAKSYGRVVEKLGGSEKAGEMLRTYRALVDNRKPVGCVHDTADGLLISLIESMVTVRGNCEFFLLLVVISWSEFEKK